MKALRYVVPMLIGGLIFGGLPLVHGQNAFSTAAIQAWKQSITVAGYMGAPRYTTAALPTCDTNNKGALAYDTTTSTLSVCSGTAWGSAGISSTQSGDYVLTGKWTFGTAADAASTARLGEVAGCLVFEGATADAHESILCATDPTVADQTYNLPNAGASGTHTIAVLGLAQSFSQVITFSAGAAITSNQTLTFGSSVISNRSALTPDAPILATATTSESWHVLQSADSSSDLGNGACGTVACTDPALIVHTTVNDQTQYNTIAAWGTASKTVKTLTESAATSTVRIPVAAEVGTAGQYLYTIYATDGSTPQVRSGRVIFSVTADGATETCVLGTPEETDNTPTGTLTVTVTCDTTPSNAVDIQLNAVSSLTQTTLEAYSRVELVGPGEPARQ